MSKYKINKFVLINEKTPEGWAKMLSRTRCCRGLFDRVCIENWIHDYISYSGEYCFIGRESKAYILYTIIYVLNELKPLQHDKMETYLNCLDTVLDDVIQIASEEKNVVLDKFSALGLCSKIIVDYECEELEPISDCDETEDCALRQIIRNYKDLFFWLFDPVWEWTFDILMDLNDDNENEVYQKYDINQLQQAVRERQLLPACYYENMQKVDEIKYGKDTEENKTDEIKSFLSGI